MQASAPALSRDRPTQQCRLGHPVLGPLDRRQQLGRRLGDEASHQMIRTVTFLDLANPLLGRDRLTIGEVVISQHHNASRTAPLSSSKAASSAARPRSPASSTAHE